MKKETTLMINEDINEKRKSKRISESETGESKKGGKKSLIEKREGEVKVRYSLYLIMICSFVKCIYKRYVGRKSGHRQIQRRRLASHGQ